MIVLRDDQELVVGEARDFIRQGFKRILVQAPTGFGKTVVGSFMVLGAVQRRKRVTFMAHREELIQQAARTFKSLNLEPGFISASFTPNPHALVQIAGVDTLRNRLEKVPVPDMLVVDECHHAVSPSWRKVIDYYHSRGALIVGLSATPKRLSGEPLRDCFDVMVKGPRVADLIARGSLCEYDYFCPPPMFDLAGVKKVHGEYSSSQLAAKCDKPEIIGNAVEHYQRLLPGKRAIVFAVNIKHSNNIVNQFRAAGIPAAHVDGETPTAERKAKIAAFERGEILVLSNVSLFGEGFDVKACDAVIMMRATASEALFLQMCGRALRPHEGKRALILDHVCNAGMWSNGDFVRKHGFPDDDREWTLDGREKKSRGPKESNDDLNIQQCTQCYSVHERAPQCPFCGFTHPVRERSLEQVDGELTKIDPKTLAQQKWARKSEVASAETLEQLKAIEVAREYTPGWANHIWQSRQRKKASRTQLEAF